MPPEHKELLNFINEALEPRYEVKIEFAIFGLRNLMKEAKDPEIKITVTNGKNCIPDYEEDPGKAT